MSPILGGGSGQKGSTATLDQVTAAVMRAKFDALLGEMSVTLQNSSRSRRISVQRQFGCALLDLDGEVIACDNPRHLPTIRDTARSFTEEFAFDLAVDDVIVANDPLLGGISVHYMTMLAPFGIGEDIHGYLVVQAHTSDVGGITFGNYDPAAVEMRAEGLRYTPLRLVRYGRMRRDLLDTVLLNGREPETFRHDLDAMLACLAVGRRRSTELIEDYGVQSVQIAFSSVLDYSERLMRRALEALPEGDYSGECIVEDDFHGRTDLTVRVKISKKDDEVLLDFTETDEQSSGFINSTPSNTEACALMSLLPLIDDSVPRNGGLLRPLAFKTAPGTLTEVRRPAPTGLSTDHVGHEIAEAVRRAIETAVPERTGPSTPSRPLAFTVRKETLVGRVLEQLDMTDLGVFSQAGASAGHEVDGWGQPGPVSLGLMPSIEEIELESDLAFRRLEYRCDSGGAGRLRGGLGTETVITFPKGSNERLYSCLFDAENASGGLAGGLGGQAAGIAVRRDGNEVELAGSTADFSMAEGVEVIVRTPGGAGYGDPQERGAEEVEQDVEDGFVSPKAAADLYGAKVSSNARSVA